MTDSQQRRRAMVESQLRPSRVTDARILGAFLDVERETFVPAGQRAAAYVDERVSLGGGRALMEPRALGRLLVSAAIEPDDRVLVVGAGTGYAAALVARLAGEVVALECDPALAAEARRLLAGCANVSVVEGPLAQGWAQAAPYDVILLDGAAVDVPQPLVDQLAESGVMAGVRVENGVGRGFTARKANSGLGLDAFMDTQAAVLPGLGREPSFVF